MNKINQILGLDGWQPYESVRADTLLASQRELQLEYDSLATDEVEGLFERQRRLVEKIAVQQDSLKLAEKAETQHETSLLHATNDIDAQKASIRTSIEAQGSVSKDDLRYFRAIVAESALHEPVVAGGLAHIPVLIGAFWLFKSFVLRK